MKDPTEQSNGEIFAALVSDMFSTPAPNPDPEPDDLMAQIAADTDKQGA